MMTDRLPEAWYGSCIKLPQSRIFKSPAILFDGSSMVKAAMEEQVCFDLVYLDVETEDMDGIRAALALRDAELPVLIDT